MKTVRVELDKIQPPSRTEKLHPYEKETDGDWEEFVESVGSEPDKPLDVWQNGNGYTLIDGDRRVRALKDNDAQTVRCHVFDEGEMTQEEMFIRRVRDNEHREANDPDARSWYTAQFVAPWLLPPGERRDFEQISQRDYANEVGKSQGTISNWLDPLREKRPIRAALGRKGTGSKGNNRPTKDEIEMIDEMVDILTGANDNPRIVPAYSEDEFGDELDRMTGVSIAELHQTAQKAKDNRWVMADYNAYVEEHFASNTVSDKPTETGSTDTYEYGTVGDFDSEPNSNPTEDTNPNRTIPEVDWEEIVDDEDLPDDITVEQVMNRKMATVTIEGEAAVAIYMVAEMRDTSFAEAMERIEPAIVNGAVDILE